MNLDLLYEIDMPNPWWGVHPYGQREQEQHAYAEMLGQVRLADEVGFHTPSFVEHHLREGRSHCPSPQVAIGALTQAAENLRLLVQSVLSELKQYVPIDVSGCLAQLINQP